MTNLLNVPRCWLAPLTLGLLLGGPTSVSAQQNALNPFRASLLLVPAGDGTFDVSGVAQFAGRFEGVAVGFGDSISIAAVSANGDLVEMVLSPPGSDPHAFRFRVEKETRRQLCVLVAEGLYTIEPLGDALAVELQGRHNRKCVPKLR